MDLIQLAIAYRQMEGMVEAARETWNDVIVMMDLMLNMDLSKSKHECVYDLWAIASQAVNRFASAQTVSKSCTKTRGQVTSCTAL
jgi:hypothetical protein